MQTKCPNCGSFKTMNNRYAAILSFFCVPLGMLFLVFPLIGIMVVLIFGLGGFYFLTKSMKYTCNNCKNEFNDEAE